MNKNDLEVAAAILIDDENKILLARKKEGKSFAGYWEFPGGKIEAGESPEKALQREIREELSILIHDFNYYHDYHFIYPDTNIHFHFYTAKYSGKGVESQDHDLLTSA